MMRKRTMLYSMLLITLLMAGCIKEDMADCPPSFSLYFSYKGDGNTEMFLEKERNVILFVYDYSSESLIKKIALNRSDLVRQQGVDLDLPTGRYYVVCWGNVDKNTQMSAESLLNGGSIGSAAYYAKEAITTNDSLYYGGKEINIIRNGIDVVDTIKFKSDHIKMRIVTDETNAYVEDPLNNTRATNDTESILKIEMGNLSPTINFMDINSTEKVSYYPTSILNKNKAYQTDFNVFRFSDNNDVYISLRNRVTNDVIYTMSLMEYMRKNNITVNDKNEVTIGIRFALTGMSITVKPWDEEVINPGI